MIELLDYMNELLQLKSYGATIGLMLGVIHLFYSMARTLNFSYYFYIDHGFILFESGSSGDNVAKIKKTLKKLNRNDSIYAMGYPKALFINIMLILILILLGSGWHFTIPIAAFILIVYIPTIIIKRAARKKRNKVIFEEKLNGTHK